jgi:hypothetical protein
VQNLEVARKGVLHFWMDGQLMTSMLTNMLSCLQP